MSTRTFGTYGGRYVHPGWAGGFIYDRPGDGLPPLPAYRLPGGGWVVNRPGDGGDQCCEPEEARARADGLGMNDPAVYVPLAPGF